MKQKPSFIDRFSNRNVWHPPKVVHGEDRSRNKPRGRGGIL